MSKVFKTASSVSAVALVLSGVVVAAPPTGVGFDEWSVSTGTISTVGGANDTDSNGCPDDFVCTGAVTGDGFYQDMLTHKTDSSVQFFRTIVTDKGSSGSPGALTFSDESYVALGNSNGLADKSYILEKKTTNYTTHTLVEDFYAETEIGTGWAGEGGTTDILNLKQVVQGVDNVHEDFRTDFVLQQKGVEAAAGKHMRIEANVGIDEGASSYQDFVLVERSHSFVNAGAVNDLGGVASKDISWSSGEASPIKAVWVGQDMKGIAGVAQEFGYTSYETSSAFIDAFSLAGGASTGPLGWDSSLPPDGWGSFVTKKPGDAF